MRRRGILDNPGGNGETLALGLLTVGEVAHSFSSFMPSRFTIANWVLQGKDGEQAQRIKDLRSGYAPSLLFGLGLAGAVSLLAKSALPLIMSGIAAAGMVLLYEQALPPDLRLLAVPGAKAPKVTSQMTMRQLYGI